jgi:predicted alpha/beta-hydrolase family hydrolase
MEATIDAGGSGKAPFSLAVFGSGGPVLVLGHGAGGNRKTPWLVRMAEALGARGRRVVLYNFPYTEAGRKVPDKPETLEAATAAAAEWCRSTLGAEKLALGGKSMGGRIASQAVAKGLRCDALVFLGYPLHPPGQPDKLRDAHLAAVLVPMLFLQGTRDAFASWERLEPVLARLPKATLHKVEGGDHSFAVPKRTGRTPAAVEAECAAAVCDWLSAKGL